MKNATSITASPFRHERDCRMAIRRLEALSVEDDDDAMEEASLLEMLIGQFESRNPGFMMSESSRADGDEVQLANMFPHAETLPLASFNLPNGNEVRFLGVPALEEIMVGEIADAGAELFLINPEMQPSQIFREIAPKDCAVPRMLVQGSSTGMFADRPVVDVLEQPVNASLPGLDPNVARATRSNAGSCQPGPAGAQYFIDNHCNSAGGPGYGKSESYCFAEGSEWIQKTSDSRRRATYARIASCGTGQNRMRHFYRTASGYTTQVNVIFNPEKVVSWWSAKKGISRYRRVRMEGASQGAWVRGWIKYHSKIAGGWF